MQKFTLFVALLALVIAVLAYQRAGGGVSQNVQSIQNAIEVMRKETADALARIERSVRPTDEGAAPVPAKPKP
jgi:lysylphosphatidylglycerol synthetase-like protein (DUF2156 family)